MLLQKKLAVGTKIVPIKLQATTASYVLSASTSNLSTSTKTSLEDSRSTFILDCPITTTNVAGNGSSVLSNDTDSTSTINPELTSRVKRSTATETLLVNRKQFETSKTMSQPKIQKVLFTSATPSTATFISPNGKAINLPTALLHNEQVLQELVQTVSKKMVKI